MPTTPLDAQSQSFIEFVSVAAASAPPIGQQTPAEARAGWVAYASLNGPGPEMGEVRDLAIPGPAGAIPARLYRPLAAQAGDSAVIVYFHGGGMVIGSMDSYDHICRLLADAAGAVVVNVDYRLAPEHPYPAAPDDAWSATCWVVEHAADLGVDPTRVVVAGDSAGGNLAALTALRARDAGGPTLALQLLVYPVIDFAATFPSNKENGEGLLLTAAHMEWFTAHYLGDGEAGATAAADPGVSPWYAEELSGVCPAWVLTVSHDPLRDEGTAYAERLEQAGVPTTLVRVDGVFHGFWGMTNLFDAAAKAMAEAGAAVQSL